MKDRTESGTEQKTKNKQQATSNRPQRKGDDIAKRLLDVVDDVRRLLPTLPSDPPAKHAAKQLWRATTGGGSNYEEARASESCADFVHKVRVATKELRETLYWLRVLRRADWADPIAVNQLLDEVDQLIAILVVSARTARLRQS